MKKLTKKQPTKPAKQQHDAVASLKAKRAELVNAETALTAADAAMDTDTVMTLTQRIAVLKKFIGTLEVEAAGTLEVEAEGRARVWLDEDRADSVASITDQITAVQAKARASLAALLSDLQAEGALRATAQQQIVAAEVLHARFPAISTEGARAAKLPAFDDCAGPVVRAADAMYRPVKRGGLMVLRTASMSPETCRRNTLNAVAVFVDRHGKSLPEEVRAILAAAPVPADVSKAPRMKVPSAGDQHLVAEERARVRRGL